MDNYWKMRDRTSTSINIFALTGGDQVLWTANPRRRSVCLFIPSGLTLYLSYGPMTGVNQGLPCSQQTYPYIFDQDRFGDFCCRTVHGWSTLVSTGGILEVFDDAANIDLSSVTHPNFTDPGIGATPDRLLDGRLHSAGLPYESPGG
jgi:hypothetical protein